MPLMTWATHVIQWRSTKGCKAARQSEPQKSRPSSDRRLQPACVKSESLVIVGQHTTVNTFPGLVHTARHTYESGTPEVRSLTARRARPKVGSGTKKKGGGRRAGGAVVVARGSRAVACRNGLFAAGQDLAALLAAAGDPFVEHAGPPVRGTARRRPRDPLRACRPWARSRSAAKSTRPSRSMPMSIRGARSRSWDSRISASSSNP